MDIKITVRNKLPICGDVAIVCNNSDYTVIWELDEEWSSYDTKTMRTVYKDGTYTDTVFTGDTAALPVVTVPGTVKIGLYAGDIRTSRAALIRAFPSITSDGGAPAAPSDDVYNQIMEQFKGIRSVPEGGSKGQVLTKLSGGSGDAGWQTPTPKLFYAKDEVVAELVTLNDEGDVGYKDVVVYTQKESVSGNEVYYIGDSENRKNWFKFRQSEDGSGLVFNRWSKDGIIDLTIMSSEKLANGVWMATLKNNKKDTYDAIRSTYDIPIGINLLPEGVAIGAVYREPRNTALTTPLCVDLTDRYIGYVGKSAVSVHSQSELRECILSEDAYLIICGYDNAPFDVVFVKSFNWPSYGYTSMTGVGFKGGMYGSVDVIASSRYENPFSVTFKPTSGSLLVTLTSTDDQTYTADVDFEDIFKAVKSGVPTMLIKADVPNECAGISVVTDIIPQDNSVSLLYAINHCSTMVFGVYGTDWELLDNWLFWEADYAQFSSLGLFGTKVGQLVRVADVDDDGVPQAWEAVDPEEIMIIKSSTPNSTKKFKITVDDSGVISATEVLK